MGRKKWFDKIWKLNKNNTDNKNNMTFTKFLVTMLFLALFSAILLGLNRKSAYKQKLEPRLKITSEVHIIDNEQVIYYIIYDTRSGKTFIDKGGKYILDSSK